MDSWAACCDTINGVDDDNDKGGDDTDGKEGFLPRDTAGAEDEEEEEEEGDTVLHVGCELWLLLLVRVADTGGGVAEPTTKLTLAARLGLSE